MNILHLALGGCLKAPPVSFGVTADTGGHISYILEAAEHQAQLDGVDQVTIVTRLFHDERLDYIHSKSCERISPGLSIDRVATGDHRYLEKEALGDDLPAFTDAFCDYLARGNCLPDIIHAHFADAASVAIVAQAKFGIPFIYTPHSLGIDKHAQQIACPGLAARIEEERGAIRAASAIIVSTQDEATQQIGRYDVAIGDRVHVVAPGVPRRHLVSQSQTLVDDLPMWLDRPELPIVLAIARPVAKKNLAALVRAYAGHARLRDAANLVILAGQHDHACDEERAVLDELRRLAAEPMAKGRVMLPPRHDVEDVAALYARAAQGGVFVNPALHEPFGLTVIEAAAAGVPVVATRNGGPEDILARIGHGVLIDPRDDAAIADAIWSIVGDPTTHDGFANAALTGVGSYSWHDYARRSIGVYADADAPRLLASDIDNTLTGCEIGAADFTAWRAASPLPFIVATGRSFDAARMILRRWKLPMPDAFVVDVGTRLMLPDGHGGWRECTDYARSLDEGWDRDAVAAVLAPLDITAQPASTGGPHKISFFGDADDARQIRDALDRAALDAHVIFSHGHLIDVLAPAGGKARAIAAYAARHGWTLANCVAAGDSGNDVDMLSACGRAIAVGNAGQELDRLPVRRGLYRASASHAAGLMEGLARLGLATPAIAEAA